MKFKLLALAMLVLWGAAKTPWENRLAAERKVIMTGSDLPMNYRLRDSLGQGLTMAALGGFRGLAADCLWLMLETAWEEQEWERVQALAEMCVLLQPRVTFFWDMGAWNLAWNASESAAQNFRRTDAAGRDLRERANYDARMWIEAGRDMLERGLKVIPEKPVLYQKLGDLYWQRLRDYGKAAEYYREAARRPGYPAYLDRFIGLALENAGRDGEAYDYWKQLWHTATTHPPKDAHRWDVVGEHLRRLEEKLKVPAGERLFR